MITSVEEYVSLVEHEDIQIRRVAVSAEATVCTWHAILKNRPDLASEVALNKKLPAEIIDRLIATGCSRTKSLIAMKRALTYEQFLKLAKDEEESIRAMIACNKKTPAAILEHLARDQSELVSNSAKKRFADREDVP